jgi:hypothetical protein
MGNLLSPPKESVVLIPPRISTRGLTRPVDFESPVRVQFGNLFRQEVIYDLHSFDGLVGLDVLVAPESPPAVAAHFNLVGCSTAKTVSGGFLSLFLNQSFTDRVHGWGRLSIDETSGLLGNAMLTCSGPSGGCVLTATLEEETKLGVRGSYHQFQAGVDTIADFSQKSNKVLHSPSYWLFTRVSKKVSLGLSGDLANSTRVASISLDGDIPNTDSKYCVSVESDLLVPGSVKVGFSQHLVTHRNVYNIFEEKRVKFIANYIDLALEAETRKNSAGSISAGVSWQPNKNILLKLHASSDKGVLGTCCMRNWWVPSALISGSIGADRFGQPTVGMRLQVSNWLSLAEYEKGQPVSSLPTTRWIAAEENNRFSAGNRM